MLKIETDADLKYAKSIFPTDDPWDCIAYASQYFEFWLRETPSFYLLLAAPVDGSGDKAGKVFVWKLKMK